MDGPSRSRTSRSRRGGAAGAGAALGLAVVLLAGCNGSLREELARQSAELAAMRDTVGGLRADLEGVRGEVAAIFVALEADRRAAAAAREQTRQALEQARQTIETQSARVASTERRADEVAEGLSGTETAIAALTEQLTRLEASGVGPVPLGRSRPGVPPSPEELFDRGMASLRAGELGQAVLDLEEFAERHPDHPLASSAHFWIGEAYFRTRDFEHAAARYGKSVELAPTGDRAPDALLRLGLALRSLRREERAREAWGRLVREFAESEAAQRARVLLREPGRAGRRGAGPEPR